jgi:hypothetical protein
MLFIGSGVISLLPLFGVAQLEVVAWYGLFLLPLAVLILAAIKVRGPSHWPALIRILLVSAIMMMIGTLFGEIAFRYGKPQDIGTFLAFSGLGLSFLSICGLAIAPFLDLNLRYKYDALHWLGAALLPAHGVWLVMWVVLTS